VQCVVQDWLVLTVLTHESGLAVGVVAALQFAPVLALSAWSGVLADRVNRRKLIIATQSGLALLALGLGALVLSGHVQLWHVYIFATLLGCVSAIDNPVRQTFVADMVPAAKLPNAVGLNSASFHAARFIGPRRRQPDDRLGRDGLGFLINGISFPAAIFALTQMCTRELAPMPHTDRQKGQIRPGCATCAGAATPSSSWSSSVWCPRSA